MKSALILLVSILSLAIVGISANQCEMCQFAYSVTEDLVVRNVSASEILPILHSACDFHSEEFSMICREISTEYTFELVANAIETESPINVCSDIGMCQNDMVGRWHPHNPVKKLRCSACKHIVRAAEHSINKSYDEASQYAKHQCRSLGKLLAHECEKIVGKIFRKVFDEVKRHENANNICKHVHMC
eukprot:gene8648-10645_t